MESGLRSYSAAELRVLPYKKDIDYFHRYIVDSAKDGYETLRIELHPVRSRIVLTHLQNLFPDTSFRHSGISSSKESYGYVIYKVSWIKKDVMNRTEIYPFHNRSKAVRF
jgi:hypothetical protein